MERRLTVNVPSRVTPSSAFVQPGDVDAVASEMFEIYERDQHENERVERAKRREGKGNEGKGRGERNEGGCW